MKFYKGHQRKIIGLITVLIAFYFIFPNELFNVSYSTILSDENGELLAAKIAEDGQWRFPTIDSIPTELEQCILYFEDEYFHYHPGINPVSTFRAMNQNLEAGKIISGGSTITMQVIRMSRNNPKRNYWEKLIEMYLAFRMEFSYSKEEILNLYASHAPYGGNVVGAETAAWRYFNRPLDRLSWAEYATLAVLPNAPSLIRPGKNSNKLKGKRDRLLKKLLEKTIIDSTTYSLSLLEELPGKPHALPSMAYHLMERAYELDKKGKRITSTIDGYLQKRVVQSLNNYVKHLQENKVKNACAIVVSLEDGDVKSYVGNASYPGAYTKYVDLIQSRRSSGSILKPFLYASAVEEGIIHTSTLLRDVPTSINGFSPTNFNKSYEGVVQADKALARSLNVPATNLLKEYGTVRFYEKLSDLGFTTIDRSVDNYGLTLILGGAEVTLWELVQIYSNQARTLNAFFEDDTNVKLGIQTWEGKNPDDHLFTYDCGSWWLISEALKEVQRPGIEGSWKRYSSSRKIAWKTGTSFGFRDAWAIGWDSKYLVGVWVGNATGEGRPGLTGSSTAAPLMFDIFQNITDREWFEKPEADLKYITLCKTSGFAPNPYCPTIETETVMKSKMPPPCTYHTSIQLNEKGERVYRDCQIGSTITDTNMFVLDPIASYYYKQKHPNYYDPPRFSSTCKVADQQSLAIIYPRNNSEVIIPTNFDGEYEMVLAEAAHNNPNTQLFWHLDGQYIGVTTNIHKLTMNVTPGTHKLSILDENGNISKIKFMGH
jgi:penicillin-binding protein 1C